MNKQGSKKFSLYFFVIAIVLSVVAFLVFLDGSKSYTVETSIILIPKSEKAAKDSEHIVENMRVIPTKVSFYDKMIKDNYINDQFGGLSNNKKENSWNEIIKTTRDGKSSIVDISISGKDSENAEELSDATISTLINVMSFYYNIKDDIDIRIIQGPSTETHAGSWFLFAILSLIIGTIVSFLVSLVSEVISGVISSLIISKQNASKSNMKFDFDFKLKKSFKTLPEVEAPIKSKKEPEEKIGAAEKVAVEIPTLEKKSAAPTNLPTAPGELSFIDEDYFRTNIIKGAKPVQEKIQEPETIEIKAAETLQPEEVAQDKTKSEESVQEDLHREPTQEELKKRLNQLLKGEL